MAFAALGFPWPSEFARRELAPFHRLDYMREFLFQASALRFHRLVSTQPGQIVLTSTLSSPNSVESDLVRLSSALLVMPLPNM